MSETRRPTIDDLERLLQGEKEIPLEILPSGEIREKVGETPGCPSKWHHVFDPRRLYCRCGEQRADAPACGIVHSQEDIAAAEAAAEGCTTCTWTDRRDLLAEVARLTAERDRLREALTKILDFSPFDTPAPSAMDAAKRIARTALTLPTDSTGG